MIKLKDLLLNELSDDELIKNVYYKLKQNINDETKFIRIIENTISESPQELFNRSIGDKFDSAESNKKEKEYFLSFGPNKNGTFRFNSQVYDIYEREENGVIFYALIDYEYIMLTYDIRPITMKNLNGFESLSVIQSRIGDRSAWQNIASTFVFDFLLKKYDFVISDKYHTSLGRMFWKAMLVKSMMNKLNSYVYNEKKEILLPFTNIDEFDKFYGKEFFGHQFIISNKKFDTYTK